MKKFFKILTISLLSLSMLFSVACKDDGGSGGSGGGGGGSESNLDEAFVYSMDRLKNADFSFEFVSEGASGVNLASLTTTSLSNGDETTYTGTPDYYIDEGALTYFEGFSAPVESFAKTAREEVDYLTMTVTALNKLVIFNGVTARYVGYDEENDVVTGFVGTINDDLKQDWEDGVEGDGSVIGSMGNDPNTVLPKGTLTRGVLIKIYDNEDGDEVVEYSSFSYRAQDYHDNTKGVYECLHIKYVPLKEYYFSHITYDTLPASLDIIENTGTFYVFRALNVDGEFMGASLSGQFGNSDDYSPIRNEVFFEMGNGFYVFDLESNRGLYTVGYDTIDFSLDLENTFDYSLSLKVLGGWDGFYHNVRDLNNDNVINQADKDLTLQGVVYFSNGDYISLENGKKIYEGSVWSKGTGFVRIDWEDYTATYEDGTEVSFSEFNKVAHESNDGFISIGGIVVQPHYTPENIDTGKIYGGFIPMQLMEFPAIEVEDGYQEYTFKEDFFTIFKDFLIENELTFMNTDPFEIIDYTITASLIKDTMLDEEFQTLFSEPYSVDGLKNIVQGFNKQGKDIIAECRTAFNGFERMLRKDMPKITESYALISISNRIQGKVTVSNGKFDFSGVSVTIPKTNFLHKGTTYGFMVYLEGSDTKILDGAFTPYSYDRQDKVCAGNSSISIPDVKDGTYKLKLAFGKPTDSGFIRLSNVIELDVNAFNKVEKQITINQKSYNVSYETVNGKFFMQSVYNDVGAPEIDGYEIVDDAIEVYFKEGDLVAQFITYIIVVDEVDGRIYLSPSNFTLDGNKVNANDEIDFTKTYRLIVEDSSGNKIDISVKPLMVDEK